MATELSRAFLRPLAIAPFDEWKYADAQRALADRLPADFTIIKRYAVDHDHYQQGRQWVGPGTADRTGKIADQFAPEDVISEVLANVANAFSEPQLGAAPIERIVEGQPVPENLTNLTVEMVELLSGWWDRQRLQEHIQDRQYTSAWSGFAGLRLWIPWRYLITNGERIAIRPTTEIEKALEYIHVSVPEPDAAGLLFDAGTQDHIAVFLDEEIIYNNGKKESLPRAELVYLDPDRLDDATADTIIRIVYAEEKRPALETRLPLQGNLMFSEMKVKSLITEPVVRTQRQMNLLTTLVTRIAETAAFRERYITNAKPQGLRVAYAEGDSLPDGAFLDRDEEGRTWAIYPQERTLGASTTTELVGLNITDDKGDTKSFANPSVEVIEPVDPTPYINAADGVRRRILRMCGQAHLGGVSNAEASGIAYEQARAVFEKDLNRRRVAEEGMLRDLLTTVVTLAEIIANKPGYFTSQLRLTVDQHVNAGPRSPDLVRLDLEANEAGILSDETTMSRYGIEDTSAESLRVKRSANRILELLAKAGEAANTFSPESIIEVLKTLNVPKEVVNVLEVKEEPEPPPMIGGVPPS